MFYGIAAATAALVLAALVAALLRPLALRLGVLDRRCRRPLPLLGGVAVALVTCLVAAAGEWTGHAPLSPETERLLIAAGAVAALGLIADVRRVKARFLAGGTAVAAACVVPYADTGFLLALPAIGLIVLVSVGFKALDHADGLAGTVGVLTAFGAGVCAAAEVMDELAVLLSVLAAALTGFLLLNWPPARIGLGASGSLFVGFLLASSAVTARAGHDPAPSAGVLYALTALATTDVVLVALSRRLAGRPLLRRGPDHLAHRLRRTGLTAQGATVLLGVAAFPGVLVAVLVQLGRLAATGALWVGAGALLAVFALLHIKPYGPRRHPRVPVQDSPHASGRTASSQVGGSLRVRNG
ncbi:cell surface biosynthesis associated protein [Streptomyces zinciresistens K42]|uniref:Cell surface biosynthesis associated protein n=1 Tax=Streptomyces zinciresistens K42 TaxID=700597 RepID=G2GD26_9ACTN|nr:MraY family glycosyltransferase [Streptomyces zinciresistens]EGX58559.1 cell surface biosynthesis associated protein [Streptomyces zinciresistens K42]